MSGIVVPVHGRVRRAGVCMRVEFVNVHVATVNISKAYIVFTQIQSLYCYVESSLPHNGTEFLIMYAYLKNMI